MDEKISTHSGNKKRIEELVRRAKRNQPLGGNGRVWEDNIKMDLRKIYCKNVYWLKLGRDSAHLPSFVNTPLNLPYHSNRTFLDQLK
jgi:hypothetical protein